MNQHEIQADIENGVEREYTDEELVIAFKETASDISAEDIRNEILPLVFGNLEYLGFSGQNCDDCEGASGFDRRCQCGNRRVSWASDHGHYYMEAY